MTISYTYDVATESYFGFFKVLFRWKGSVWKLIHRELFMWLVLYYTVLAIYRTLDEERKKSNIEHFINFEPSILTFMLSFFVTTIVQRWNNVFTNMGFIENAAYAVSSFMKNGEDVRRAQRTVIRYLVASQILVMRSISIKALRRFPNYESIVTAGFLTKEESTIIQNTDLSYDSSCVPIRWAIQVLRHQYRSGNFFSHSVYRATWKEVSDFETHLSRVRKVDWVPIPLAYPQVIFFAVRLYFVICAFAKQYFDLDDDDARYVIHYYFPIVTVFQFICLMGWLKVAEALLNPLGEDDDDFEVNFLIDSNIYTGMLIIETSKPPPLKPDLFEDRNFGPIYPNNITDQSVGQALCGSVENIKLAGKDASIEVKKNGENNPPA